MTEEFVTYDQALALKELGFNEPCFAFWDGKNTDAFYFNNIRDASGDYVPFQKHDRLKWFGAPLYQQVFRWFREKHNLSGIPDDESYSIWKLFHGGRDCIMEVYPLNNFEEAESDCINKLIEIVKENGNK